MMPKQTLSYMDLNILVTVNAQTLRVKHGRETANPKATTRVIADTAAPANGG